MKICSKCGVEKELNEFYNNSASTDGKRKECKECRKIGSKIYYHNNIDYYKQRRLDNPHYMK